LETGRLDGEVIAFPWHGSRWYAKTGKVIQFARVPPPERVYKVTADGEQISVEMEG
jgi:nitrite reductase/ring-hydroxylating ferredoxin subunit